MTNKELIDIAGAVVHNHEDGNFQSGGVGCALVAGNGKIYTGVCLDTMSSMGYCAEHNAIGTMVTEREFRIESIVAVWKDEEGRRFVIPPCGRCRQFIKEIHKDNLNTRVILGLDHVETIAELLPHHQLWQPIDD